MGRWLLVVALCGALCRSGTIPSDAVDRVPADQLALYVPPTSIPYPGDDPSSPATARLGQELFFDPILSGARDMSCSTCHQPALSWGDGRARAIGANHEPMALRSPTLIDVAWMERLGWDGKFRDLESVTFSPITAHDNMDLAEDEALA